MSKREPASVVIVIRDPDFSNEYETFGAKIEYHDIDAGASDLRDPGEFLEWAEGHLEAARDYEARGWKDVAASIRSTVASYSERFRTEPVTATYSDGREPRVIQEADYMFAQDASGAWSVTYRGWGSQPYTDAVSDDFYDLFFEEAA